MQRFLIDQSNIKMGISYLLLGLLSFNCLLEFASAAKSKCNGVTEGDEPNKNTNFPIEGERQRCCSEQTTLVPTEQNLIHRYSTYNSPDETIGGLQIDKKGLAREGRSFCIVGDHIRKSRLSKSTQLRGFKELLKYNLDIGNHIHPDDPSKMNILKPESRFPDILSETKCRRSDPSYKYRPAIKAERPDPGCVNPYKVEVTEITSHDRRLHNYLHIRVYADNINQKVGLKNCPTGKMKYLMLEVRDGLGLPVGSFTDEIPCDLADNPVTTGPDGIQGRRIVGTRDNHMPCMFAPRRGVTHPGIFLATSVSDGLGGESNSTDYFTEVHATWRFAQHTSQFISELHFATMIVEDPKPVRYFTSRRELWRYAQHCSNHEMSEIVYYSGGGSYIRYWYINTWNYAYRLQHQKPGSGGTDHYSPKNDWELYTCFISSENNTRPYGFYAQYKPLRPTKESLGGWDYFRKDFVSPSKVDCHKTVQSKYYSEASKLGILPTWMMEIPVEDYKKYDDYLTKEMTFLGTEKVEIDFSVPAHLPNRLAMQGDLDNSKGFVYNYSEKDPKRLFLKYSSYNTTEQPIKTYFGTKYTYLAYKNYDASIPPGIAAWLKGMVESTAAAAKPDRCPCPALATTLPPEFQTKKPLELDGRRSHASQMLVAWLVLIPIAMFSARYFKETYSRVFFMQEFWWVTVHVFTLVTAFVFMLGGVYIARLKRPEDAPERTKEMKLHVGFGYLVIVMFGCHLVLGFFRVWDFHYRIIQIILHWMFGMLEYIFGVATIFLAAVISQGFLNCVAFDIFCGFLVVQVLFHVGMDIQMRLVDKKLRLRPPRSYLPPPVMRIFHQNAPYARVRMFVLMIYYLTCIGFYVAMQYVISDEGGEVSCFEPTIQRNESVEI